MLINFPKKDKVIIKVITKKTLKKTNTHLKKIKKTKKMRRFQFRFKPIHYFLKSFTKKIKRYNIRRYKSLVKYFFRIFRCNFKLFKFEKPVELDDSLVNDPSVLSNIFTNKPLSLETKPTASVSFFNNRFINKSMRIKRRSLRRNIISKKTLVHYLLIFRFISGSFHLYYQLRILYNICLHKCCYLYNYILIDFEKNYRNLHRY